MVEFTPRDGAIEHQLVVVFGWDSATRAGVYTRKANHSERPRSQFYKRRAAIRWTIAIAGSLIIRAS